MKKLRPWLIGIPECTAEMAFGVAVLVIAAGAGPALPRDSGLGDGSVPAGDYLDWRKWTPVLGLFLLWVWTLRKVDVDSGALRLSRHAWNAAVFFPGVGGFLLALCLPAYWGGYVLLLLAYSVPAGLYVTARNRLVAESRRLFTSEHLRRMPRDFLRGLRGLVAGSAGEPGGPPVVLQGKSITGADRGERASQQAQRSRGYRAARELIYDAVTRGATDIHLEPDETEVTVRVRIDGLLKPAGPFDARLGRAVINIFKVLSALDITDKRRAQDGSFRAEVEGSPIDVRVATQGTQHGEKLSLRILDPAHSLANLPALGLRKGLQEKVRSCVQRQHGLLLVAGPTGAGKTTTLYAALREIDTRQRNVITVEDPVEYKLPGISQVEVNTRAGQTFQGALRNLLRQDPDVLLIGEIRDAETAAIACQAANTGHVVLSTIHANDSVAALFRLTELGVEPAAIAGAVTAVLGQRLLRRLCAECRRAYEPDQDTLDMLGLPRERIAELYRPPAGTRNRCPSCGGTGYSGRVGVFEFLEITPRLREMLRNEASADAILAEARDGGMLSMQEEGLGLAARGITSLEELFHVVGEGNG